MSTIGTFAIYLALYVSLVGTALAFVAGRTNSRRFLHASRFATFTSFGAIAVASSVLMHALITHDFSIEYVVHNSDHSMPLFYLIGAFWGGQAGSLLFWVSVVSGFTVLCLWVYRDTYQEFMPWVTMVSLAVISGLLLILTFGSNPFETYDVLNNPSAGQGLNPLLQTPKMVMHPPMLLAGLASMSVPFAFAIAALITGSTSSKWVEAARSWILVPWLFLTVGNILGGMWAYEELGWGGYWAWDPVENAAFMPWLMATALIHSLMIQERRGMLRRWNIGLMIGTYLLTIFGTYITRSGLIESVHTFAQSEIGDYFLAFLLSVTVSSIALFAWRWRSLKSTKKLDSVASREASFMLNNWLFLAMTLVVFFGTIWPKVREGLTGQDISIGPLWFNKWMVPLGIIMLIMMGVGTVIAWRRATWKNFRRDFVGPLVATVVATPALIYGYWVLRGQYLGVEPTGLEKFYTIATIAGCVFVTATIVQDFARGVSARMRGHDESPTDAFLKLFEKQKRRYGGYIVHLGVVFAFVAFAGNSMKIEKDIALTIGESVTVGDYTMTYKGLTEKNPPGKMLILANMDVSRNGEHAFTMHPGKAKFGDNEMMTSEIDIRSTPLEDFYVAFVSASQNGQSATFKVFVGPFTWWFWIASLVIMLGTIACLWPTRDAMKALGRSPMGFGRSAAVLSIVAISFVPLIVWQVESHTEWGSALRWEKASAFEQPSLAPGSPDDHPGDQATAPSYKEEPS
jgi:cytochrome c-type biogenesis protein CcmF